MEQFRDESEIVNIFSFYLEKQTNPIIILSDQCITTALSKGNTNGPLKQIKKYYEQICSVQIFQNIEVPCVFIFNYQPVSIEFGNAVDTTEEVPLGDEMIKFFNDAKVWYYKLVRDGFDQNFDVSALNKNCSWRTSDT